ncbi:MAG: MBL fold metallo-hydrolase [Gammaproteobacteria bacterium]|nr:MBL fold metallo-hydrolase [Gammaproteobacteria bacterium]
MRTIIFFIALIYPVLSFANTADISVTKLSADAYILTSTYATNIGLLNTTKGVVLLDPMPGENQQDTLNALVNSIFAKPVSYILNTHTHSDHSGGNTYFIAAGAELIQSAESLAEIDMLTVKSHTANDAILNLGDENSLIVPGHGKPTDKQHLKLFRQNTLQWVATVETLSKQGLTVSEIKNNAEIQRILRTFSPENSADFIPPPAFERFIERTLTVIEKGV